MKANEFVKEFGLDKAKTLLSMQGKSIEMLKSKYTARQLKEFQSYLVSGDLMRIDCLERLVESHKLVESKGGLEIVKLYLKHILAWDALDSQLSLAVKDVESCQ